MRHTPPKLRAALCGLTLVAASALPMASTPAIAHPVAAVSAEAAATAKPVPALGFSTQTLKTLNIQFQYQSTGYWCGPAATRIALSAKTSNLPSQQQLAYELPTDEEGTDHISQVTRVLNNRLNTGYYETKSMPNDPPTQSQRDLLWHDITYDIDRGWALVANIVAPANNHPPGYPNYTIWHYFTVIGYDSSDQTVLIADPAGFADTPTYWLTFNQLATLIPPKGYSA